MEHQFVQVTPEGEERGIWLNLATVLQMREHENGTTELRFIASATASSGYLYVKETPEEILHQLGRERPPKPRRPFSAAAGGSRPVPPQ